MQRFPQALALPDAGGIPGELGQGFSLTPSPAGRGSNVRWCLTTGPCLPTGGSGPDPETGNVPRRHIPPDGAKTGDGGIAELDVFPCQVSVSTVAPIVSAVSSTMVSATYLHSHRSQNDATGSPPRRVAIEVWVRGYYWPWAGAGLCAKWVGLYFDYRNRASVILWSNL